LFTHFARACTHASSILSKIRLGQSETPKLFSRLQRGQPSLLLFFTAKCINGIHHQRRLHADETAHTGVAALHFLHHQPVFHIRHTGAAVALQGRAKKSQLGHRLDQFPRKTASPIALLNDRDQIVFNKLSRSVANQSLVITEQGIEFEEIHSPELDGHGILFSVSSPRTDAGSRKELYTLAKGATAVKPRKRTSRIRTSRGHDDCDLQPARIRSDTYVARLTTRSL